MAFNGVSLEEFIKHLQPDLVRDAWKESLLREVLRSRKVQMISEPITFSTATAEGGSIPAPGVDFHTVTFRQVYLFRIEKLEKP